MDRDAIVSFGRIRRRVVINENGTCVAVTKLIDYASTMFWSERSLAVSRPRIERRGVVCVAQACVQPSRTALRRVF